MICNFCGNNDRESMCIDKVNNGFWCEWCEGYTHLDLKNRHTLKLILEDKVIGEPAVAKKTKLRKQISPLRYPGGKSKLIDYIYTQIDSNNTSIFVEPFAGGGSVGLSLLNAGVIENLVLNDLEYGIFALFNIIKLRHKDLVYRIDNYTPNREDFFFFQRAIEDGYKGMDEIDAAFAYLVVNRLAFSGIVKANPMGGKNGDYKKLTQRWNKETLIKRIKLIARNSDKITVLNEDALEVIEKYYWYDNTTIFIDPPYVEKGKDLYNMYYENEDHINLRRVIEGLHYGCPGADMILTYDNSEDISNIYSYAEQEIINRVYSI